MLSEYGGGPGAVSKWWRHDIFSVFSLLGALKRRNESMQGEDKGKRRSSERLDKVMKAHDELVAGGMTDQEAMRMITSGKVKV